MHVWNNQKDYLILFKMIPYLLWLCHWGKGSISKYGIRSQLKSCKMNTSRHEESIKNVFLCVELCLLFSAGQLINSMRMRGQAVVIGSSTRYWALIMSLKSMNIDEIRDPCDNKHTIHANQTPATSFVSLLWLMWFCEIKWFESSV